MAILKIKILNQYVKIIYLLLFKCNKYDYEILK